MIIKNERGENVWSEGSPESLARLKCEYPDTWPRMLDDALLKYMAVHPTHADEEIRYNDDGEEISRNVKPCTFLGKATLGGREHYYYAAMERLYNPNGYQPWVAAKFYTYEPLPRLNKELKQED